jgi:PiT family inorganic phosphate transporter
MTDFTINQTMDQGGPIQPAARPNLDKGFNPLTMIIFFGILAAGLLFVAYSTISTSTPPAPGSRAICPTFCCSSRC